MKNKRYLIILPILTALVACQDEHAANTQDASHAAASTTTIVASTAPASTVAVTKPAVQHNVQNLHNNTSQAKELAAAAVAQLIEAPAIPHEAKAAKANEVVKTIEAAKPAVIAKPIAITKPTAIAKPIKAIKVATSPIPQQSALGDAVQGKSLARKCMSCHNYSDKKKVGPGLKAIVGRPAGSMADMRYSKTLAAGGWTWNEQNLAVWLCDSKKAVKALSGDASGKTKMPSQRICDATKQANIIAFLKTL